MASPRPLSPAPTFPFLASLCLVQLVPKDTRGLRGGPADTGEICGLEFSGSWNVPAKVTVHTCVCLGHWH